MGTGRAEFIWVGLNCGSETAWVLWFRLHLPLLLWIFHLGFMEKRMIGGGWRSYLHACKIYVLSRLIYQCFKSKCLFVCFVLFFKESTGCKCVYTIHIPKSLKYKVVNNTIKAKSETSKIPPSHGGSVHVKRWQQGLDRWLSGSAHRLLLQRTRVQFLEHTYRLTTIYPSEFQEL